MPLDFATLAKDAASSSQDFAAAAAAQPEAQGSLGIFKYLTQSLAKAREAADAEQIEALTLMIQTDFPEGEPKPPAPVPVQRSPSHELSLLAQTSAQALRDLIAARSTLESAKDRVVAAQSQLDEAKEHATQSAAAMNLALNRYTEADQQVRNFNSKVAALEAQRSAQIVSEVAQIAAASPGTPTATEAGQANAKSTPEQTYASVVAKGKGKQNSQMPLEPVLVLPAVKRPQQPDNADEEMEAKEAEPSEQSMGTTTSKRLKKERDAKMLAQSNDLSTAGLLLLTPALATDDQYLAKLARVCHTYGVTVADVIQKAVNGENLIAALQEQAAKTEDKPKEEATEDDI